MFSFQICPVCTKNKRRITTVKLNDSLRYINWCKIYKRKSIRFVKKFE